MSTWWWAAGAVALVAVLVVFWHFHGLGQEIRTARANESFRLQKERLELLVLEKARESGLPRGLRWLACRFTGEPLFARERRPRRIVAIVAATIEFEAIEGGDMEGLPAVPLPRQGCAILHFARGEWTSAGRVVFNLSPQQVLEKLGGGSEQQL